MTTRSRLTSIVAAIAFLFPTAAFAQTAQQPPAQGAAPMPAQGQPQQKACKSKPGGCKKHDNHGNPTHPKKPKPAATPG